jgi:uncharacterized protein YcbX
VTPSGRFLTQREVPQLALVVPELTDTLTLRAPDMEALEVPLTPRTEAAVQVTIWRDHCKAHDTGREAAQWLEQCLGVRRGSFASIRRNPGLPTLIGLAAWPASASSPMPFPSSCCHEPRSTI